MDGPADGRGVHGIGQQLVKKLVKLFGVGVDRRERFGPVEPVRHVGILEDEPGGLAHQRLQRERLLHGQAAARKGEKLTRQVFRPQARFFRVLQTAQGGVAGGEEDFRQGKVAQDDGEEIVEIVRDAAGKLPEGFLFAELEEFLFGALALGDVAEDEHRAQDLIVLVPDGRGGSGHGELQTGGRAQEHLAGKRQVTRCAVGQRADNRVAHGAAAGFLQKLDVFFQPLARQHVAFHAQQRQRGLVGCTILPPRSVETTPSAMEDSVTASRSVSVASARRVSRRSVTSR